MVSAVLFTTATGPGRLLLVIHHAVVDGVSWRIILEDLARAGIAAIQGDEPSLAPVGTSVRRYAELVSEAVGAGRLDSEIDHRDYAAGVDMSLTVEQALASLPPEQRAAVVAVDVEGYPVAEAAERLGVPVGTVKSRCARARKRLAAQLEDFREGGNHS